MKLKDFNLGNLDAKNELLENTPEEREHFLKVYTLPPDLNLDNFLEGKKYFILGLKGTGKTALLRYISLMLENKNDNLYSHFILFKSDFDDSDKQSLSALNNPINVDVVSDSHEKDSIDSSYKSNWRYFLYNKIVEIQKDQEICLFQNNEIWNKFSSLVLSANKKKNSLFPVIKKGVITLSKHPSLVAEFEYKDNDSITISFSEYVKILDRNFERLQSGDDYLNIFFDELELSFYKNKQRDRDIRLIRDLIMTIEWINSKSKRLRYNLKFYSAIRSEVKKAIQSSGFEINKIIGDFGWELGWNKASTDDKYQPILNVITRRLKYQSTELENLSDDELWEKLFPKFVQKEDTRKYILHNSWYRPRDVIRLLKLAQDESPDSIKFTHTIFDSIRKKYSEDSWIELREELTAKYKPDQIESIERIFEDFKSRFSLDEFIKHVDKVKEIYSHELNINNNIDDLKILLTDLYNIGFLGNIKNDSNFRNEPIFKFFYRGNDKISLVNDFYIHPSIRRYFSIL